MRLILVRHGLTENNARRLSQGWADHPLNEIGLEQAERVGERLREERIDAAYSSDLTRTVQTLEAILRHHPHLTPVQRVDLRERNYGAQEGRSYDAFTEEAHRSGIPFHEFRPERGENLVEVRARLEGFIEELRRRHAGQTVLLVSHGGVLAVLLLHLLGLPWSKIQRFRQHPNTAVSELVWDANGSPRLVRLKDASHLPPELTGEA